MKKRMYVYVEFVSGSHRTRDTHAVVKTSLQQTGQEGKKKTPTEKRLLEEEGQCVCSNNKKSKVILPYFFRWKKNDCFLFLRYRFAVLPDVCSVIRLSVVEKSSTPPP